MHYLFLILFSPFIFIYGGFKNFYDVLYRKYKDNKLNIPKNIYDFPTYYEWDNHLGISNEELFNMAKYREYVIIPRIINFLESFIDTKKYSVNYVKESVHSDRIEIVEKYGDKYIVGSIFIRGHSTIVSCCFNNCGPRIVCKKCGASYRIDDYKNHVCGENTFDTVNVSEFGESIDKLSGVLFTVNEEMNKVKNIIKKLDVLNNKS